MNNKLLSTALLTVLSTATYADATQPNTAPSAPAPAPSTPSAAPSASAPIATPSANAPKIVPTPEIKMGTGASPATTLPTPQIAPVINCKYHIAADTGAIAQSYLSTWAGKAAVQSFDFNPIRIDDELTELKTCYTDQGWQGFNDALKKSGNIESIKTQHLTVSSQIEGDVKITLIKDNQWKASVPLQVVYQNDKEKLTQLLTVNLLIGRKISGDLGIMQMIATPQQAANTQQAEEKPVTPAPTNATADQQAPAAPSTTNAQQPTNPGAQPPVTFTPPKQ